MLDLPVKDWDVEVFGVAASDLQDLLEQRGSVNLVGRSFGVLKWTPRGKRQEIDVSIPRRDSRVGVGHRGIQVEGDPDMAVEEAVRRRDLTINAMMIDLVSEQLVDPAGGQSDLQAGRLRAVDPDTFLEDPLRALRVIQFAGRLGFVADEELVGLCQRAPLHELPAERIREEWQKLMLLSDRPSRGLSLASRTGVNDRVFPHAASCRPIDGDALLDRLAQALGPVADAERMILMLAGWLADGTEGAVVACLDVLGLFRMGRWDVRSLVVALVANWRAPLDSDTALRRLATHTRISWVLALRRALEPDQDWSRVQSRAAALGVLEEPLAPLLQGRDLAGLGIAPGPHMGVILREVYDAQLEGRIHEKAAALKEAAAIWARRPQ